MAKFKLVSGNINKNSELSSVFGVYALSYRTGVFSSEHYNILENLVSITPITEENKKSFIGKAGWGLVGGLALGPVGMLAGLLAGGNKQNICCAFEMLPNYRFIAEIEGSAYHDLAKIAMKNADKKYMFQYEDDGVGDTTVDETNSSVSSDSLQEKLLKLKTLKENDLITEEEYAELRKKILDSL